MSKVAVVYQSKYGSTEKYAKWISEETGADLFLADKCKADQLKAYDVIVYGGCIHAGGVMGIKFLQKNFKNFDGKKVLAFAVGLNISDDEVIKQCREINFVKNIKDVPCYFFRGAYDPDKISGMDKPLMAMVKKMVSGKSDDQRSQSESELLDAIENGADYTDKAYISELVEAIKK